MTSQVWLDELAPYYLDPVLRLIVISRHACLLMPSPHTLDVLPTEVGCKSGEGWFALMLL